MSEVPLLPQDQIDRWSQDKSIRKEADAEMPEIHHKVTCGTLPDR